MSSENSVATSLTLLSKIEAHDPDAWERFVRLYAPLVYSWARNAGVDASEVADIAQEVFAVVARKIPQFERDRCTNGGFRAWMWGITRIRILDHFRKRSRAIPVEGGSEARRRMQELQQQADEPDSINGNDPQQLILQTAIGILQSTADPMTWKAFWYMAVDGRQARDIGGELGMTARAVRQAKYRVSRKLRLLLGDDFPLSLKTSETSQN